MFLIGTSGTHTCTEFADHGNVQFVAGWKMSPAKVIMLPLGVAWGTLWNMEGEPSKRHYV